MEIDKEFEKEYADIIKKIENLKKNKINKIKNKFIKKLPFKTGDIVYNVCGIIKIENIEFIFPQSISEFYFHVEYIGSKYKWIKDGFVVPAKSKVKGKLYSYGQ